MTSLRLLVLVVRLLTVRVAPQLANHRAEGFARCSDFGRTFKRELAPFFAIQSLGTSDASERNALARFNAIV